MNEDEINKLIGENLRAARVKAGYKLKDVAERTGLTYQQVQKYELGQNRITAARVVLIAKVFLMEPSDLLPEVF